MLSNPAEAGSADLNALPLILLTKPQNVIIGIRLRKSFKKTEKRGNRGFAGRAV